MNKADLINDIHEETGMTKKDIGVVVDTILDVIVKSLSEGETVKLHNFGNFEVRERAARKGRNPQTGQEIEIPKTKVPAFKPLKGLKDAVKGQ